MAQLPRQTMGAPSPIPNWGRPAQRPGPTPLGAPAPCPGRQHVSLASGRLTPTPPQARAVTQHLGVHSLRCPKRLNHRSTPRPSRNTVPGPTPRHPARGSPVRPVPSRPAAAPQHAKPGSRLLLPGCSRSDLASSGRPASAQLGPLPTGGSLLLARPPLEATYTKRSPIGCRRPT